MSKESYGFEQILVLLILYADSTDVFTLIRFCYPYIPINSIVPSRTVKEFLLEKLVEPQYKIFEAIHKNDLKQVKKYIDKSKLEVLIYHLLALQKSYFYNYLFVTHEEVKDKDNRDIASERILRYMKGKSSAKNGLKKLLKYGNINENEISKILHIMIESYKKYDFYYLFYGDNIKKVTITYKKGHCSYIEDVYKIKQLARKTQFININTNNKIEVDKPIKQFFINEHFEMDLLSVSFNKFQKLNAAIYEGLSKDIPTETCAWCNPDKYHKKQRKLCDNCTFLLEKIRLLQSKSLLHKFNIFTEMNTYTWKDYKTLKGLRRKRKEHLIELLGDFYGLDDCATDELRFLIEKSFRDID